MKNFLLPLMALAIPALQGSATTHTLIDSSATTATQQLYAELQTLDKADGVAFGNEYAFQYGILPDGTSWYFTDASGEYLASDIQNICGIRPSVSGWDLNEFALGNSYWKAEVMDNIEDADALGVIVCLTFHENNPATGNGYSDTNIDLTQVVTSGTTANTQFLSDWSKAADVIRNLKRSDGTLIPVILRPFHECNGGWFWWGTNNSDAKFIALWKYLVTYLRDTQGLHNIIYVYNTSQPTTSTVFLERYPGDDYADVISTDVYLTDSDASTVLTVPLDIMISIAEAKGMPAALAEIGSNAGSSGMGSSTIDAWWTTKVLTPMKQATTADSSTDYFAHIAYMAGWASWSTTQYHIPYPGCSKAADFKTFLQDSHIYLLNHFDSGAVYSKTPLLGWAYCASYPWVYSYNFGWEYMGSVFNAKYSVSTDSSNFGWFYDWKRGAWLWTSKTYSPYFWQSGYGWLYYVGTGSTGIRWFYDFVQAKYVSDQL